MSRILYVIDRPNSYGSEQHLFDVVSFQHRSHAVRVLAFRNGPLISRLQAIGIEVETVEWLSWTITPTKCRRLMRTIRRFGPDLVHSHQPKASFYCSLLCRLHGIPHVPTIHTLPVQAAARYRGIKRAVVYAFHLCVMWSVELLSGQTIHVSRYTIKRYALVPHKAILIRNWLSPQLLDSSSSIRPPRSNRYNYLCVGSIDPSKGTLELITLFDRLLRYQPAARLTIVGDGQNEPYKRQVEHLILSRGLAEQVVLAGYQDNPSAYYSTHDVFILLTKGESFGLVFVEAMYYGLLVICPDLDILREIVHSANLFIDPKAPDIERAVAAFVDSADVEGVAAANRSWAVEQYDYETQQRKLAEAYDRILRAAR